MKFELLGDWPCDGGALLVPAGTILDRNDWKFKGTALSWPPPMNARALDQDGYDLLAQHYPSRHIQSVSGIERHADPGKRRLNFRYAPE